MDTNKQSESQETSEGVLKQAARAPDYAARRLQEERFFGSCEVVHDLPDIFHYWSEKHIRPKLRAVGVDGSKELFADTLRNHCERSSERAARFLSIGSGNSDLEIEFARDLRAAGHSRFVIDCLDLNEAMQERGRAAAAKMNVAEQVSFISADFNKSRPEH